MIIDELFEGPQMCPECGGISFSDLILAEKKDACYHKVKASAKVWPSAYASGRLVQCRKKGAANYGNKSEGVAEGSDQQWVVTVGTKTGGTSHTMTFSGTKEQAIKQAVARFGTSKNPVVTAKPKQQGVAEANLSELNKDTVYSYAKKAHKDQDKQSTITGKAYLDNDPKTANKAHHKFSMRAAGLDRAEKRLNKEGVAEGWKDVVAGGALALGALGAGAQTMPNINAQQVELTNKYYNALVQRAKEDGRELDRRTLNFLKAKAEDAAALKLQQASPKKQQGFPAQGSERRVSRNIDNFESQGVAEGTGNIGSAIKSLYQKIYNAGDDEIDYFYHDSPIFAQYWDEYEGDLDSIIAEVDPSELQVMHDELESYVQQAGLAEEQELDEKWSQKYKSSINCANPKGFSQRAHCAGRKKNEDVAETRRGQIPMTLQPGETDNIEPENISGFRTLPAYKQGQAAQQKAGKQLIQQSPFTFQSDQDWAYRQGAFDTQQAAMFANFGGTKPLTTAEGEQQKGADYRDPKEVDYDGEYDAMVARVKRLAGLGPMKTVYDPKRRVYRNMPTAQQPKK